jgi:hypothetical protein
LKKKSLAIEGYPVPFVLCRLPLGCCRSSLLLKNYLIATSVFGSVAALLWRKLQNTPESSSLCRSWHQIEMSIDECKEGFA